MKRKVLCTVLTVFCILCVAVAGIVGCVSVGAEATTAIRIVKSTNSSQYDDYAAGVLQTYLGRILGVQVEIVTDDEAAQGNEVCVGNTNRLATPVDMTNWKNGQYVITATANYVSIVGNQGGAGRGAFRFLEEYCGCHWYSDDEVVVPTNANLMLPTSGEISYSPYFEYADEDWASGDAEFSMANGLNGGVYRSLSEEQGGTVGYIRDLCHTLSTKLCTVSKYFGTHPEYFAYRDGARQSSRTQLCLTNQEVLDILKTEVLGTYNPVSGNYEGGLIGSDRSRVGIVSLTQDDNYNYCECDNCNAYAAAHGGVQSAAMINMANYVAKAVKDAGYDNILIDTFAYQYTRKAPTGLTIEDNVIVRLCTIECCFAHALDDPDCEENVDLMNDLSDWKELTNRIYVWDYTTNYARTLGYFPDFGTIQRNAQIFYENNVLGIYEEGNYYIGACNTEFGALRRYLLAKVLQNPYCDYYKEMKDFCDAYYGDAGESIYNFIVATSQNAANADNHLMIYVDMNETLTVSDAQYDEYEGYWTAAKAAVQDGTKYMSRVLRSELCWRFWKSANYRGEFKGFLSQTRIENNKKLYDDIKASGAYMYCESDNAGISVAPGYEYLTSDNWRSEMPLFDLTWDIINWQFGTKEGVAGLITAGIIGVGCVALAIIG